MTLRSKIAMLVAEFLGTAILATAAINITRSQIGIGYFISIGMGLTFGLLALVLASTSGAHLNPAITIGQWSIRKIPTLQAIAYIAAQVLGGIVAWKVNQWLTGNSLSNIAGKSFELKVFAAETIGTFVFAFGYAAAVYQKRESAQYAATVGGALLVGILIATIASNGVLNPAIALGNQSWGRAYIFGPIIGSVVGMYLYALLFAPGRFLAASNATTSATTVSRVSTTSAAAPVEDEDDDEPVARKAVRSTRGRKKAPAKSTRTRKATTTRRRTTR